MRIKTTFEPREISVDESRNHALHAGPILGFVPKPSAGVPLDQPPPHVLPAPDAPFEGIIAQTYRDSKPEWPRRPAPPKGAPNIIVILMDDLGFGQLSCYGGPIEAPHIAGLAAGGLRYNNFHTTALCSPTRAALLTGRNHHSVGFAAISEMATGFPGSNTFLPRSAATIAEVLKQSGYSTFACGKWHLTPTSESTAAGPFERWPLGQGFERFYGFLPGLVDQWHPMITVDNHRIPTPTHEHYHLSEDVVEQAIRMLRDQQQVATGRPFFLYLPFGAPHCPFHVPQRYIERYHGRFDQGWDVLRERTFARQKAMGIVPTDAELPSGDTGVQSWESLAPDERRLFARLQETFCGFVDHADEQTGRLLAALREMDIFENTAILFMSDNGASQEGQSNGTLNGERFRNLMPMTVQEMMPHIDAIGGRGTDPHYPRGWGMAGNTPFRRYKRDTHRGGNTDPLIVHWPARITEAGQIRSQYLHVIDVYPTLLELAGLPVPQRVNGVDQKALEGCSFAATLFDSRGRTERSVQYYEMLGSRAIWQDGWMAVTWHQSGTDWQDDRWELYHQAQDFTQAHDLAAEHPEHLAQLIELWWSEARRHQVLPLDDRFRERVADTSRPTASEWRDVYRYFPGTTPVPNQALPVTLNSRHSYTAHLTLHLPVDSGFVVGQGSELSGWALLVREGAAAYVSNCVQVAMGELHYGPLPVGREFSLGIEVEPVEIGVGRVRMLLDGQVVASAERIRCAPMGYSNVIEGLQVGRCWGTPIAPQHYRGEFPFTGTIRMVELRTDPASQLRRDSFADPGETAVATRRMS